MADTDQKGGGASGTTDEQELLYKALGALLLIKDKFAGQLDELFEKANASKEEIAESIDQTRSRAEEQKGQIENRLKQIIKSILDEMGLATKEDIEELKRMIRESKSGDSGSL